MNVYGKNVIKELIKNNDKINKVYLYEHFSDKDLILELQKRNIDIKYLSKNEMDKLEKGNHQGIIVSVADYQYTTLDKMLASIKDIPFLLILDHIEDPHNLGAIIRTCEAGGVNGIIIPKDRSVDVNSTVMKVSAGAANNVPICRVVNLTSTIKELKEKNIWIVGTDMDTKTFYTSFDYTMPVALIIGNEGKGISKIVRDNCDEVVKVPMLGEINSLNASVVAGIMIYEVIRQRRK